MSNYAFKDYGAGLGLYRDESQAVLVPGEAEFLAPKAEGGALTPIGEDHRVARRVAAAMGLAEGVETKDLETLAENENTHKDTVRKLMNVVAGLNKEIVRLRTERNTLGNALKENGRSEAVDLVRDSMEKAGELD